MKHVLHTDAVSGVPIADASGVPAAGGIWKQTIYAGVGETPSLGSTVRIHYNAYFELNDEPYDSTVSLLHPSSYPHRCRTVVHSTTAVRISTG